MPQILAVLFDYGLVLTGPPDPAAQQRLETLLATDHESLHPLYWKYRDAYDRGALSGAAYWTAIARDLTGSSNARSLDASTLAGLLAADTDLWTQPNQPMIDWAAALQRAGVRTGILSNLGDAMESGIRARFPWLADFQHHTFSHRLGIAKPDAAIYKHAVDGLGVSAGQILFIDDREENIAAARAAGLQAVRYMDHASFVEDLAAASFAGLPLPA